jgi:DNA-binding transcriptional MerR regulator
MPQESAYTIVDLSRLTGLNVRTIRYYLAQGLIPASGESGPGAHYGAGHLDRLRLIKLLQTQYLPNAEIRRRLSVLSDEQVAALVGGGAEQPAPHDTTALEYVRNLLERDSNQAPTPPIPMATPGAREPSTPVARAPMASGPPADARTPAPAPSASGVPVAPKPSAAAGLMRRLVSPARMRVEQQAAASPAAASPAPPLPVPAPTPVADARAGAMPSAVVREDATAGSYAAIGMGNQAARSQWERLQLTENIELHIRRPLSRLEQRRVERLITIARQVLDEE